MRTKTILPFIGLLLLSFLPASAGEKQFTGDMVIAGSWHGDEVVAKNGETWLALTEDKGKGTLQEVVISVALVEDAVLDTPPAKTGKQISLPEGVDAIVLLRNLPALKAGPVAAAEIIDRDFSAGKPTDIYFNGMLYEIEIQCDASLRSEKFAECPMNLIHGSKVQRLASYQIYAPGTSEQSIASDAFPQLFWAGDLDGDDRLDLIIDLTNHYNVSAPTLLLSSGAKEGELLHPVAEFRTTGC